MPERRTLRECFPAVDAQSNGSARIQFPTILGCHRCGGVRGLIVSGETILDPELAAQAALIIEGYNLCQNEQAAKAGCFAGKTGHDGWMDDWQSVEASTACSCTQALETEKAA